MDIAVNWTAVILAFVAGMIVARIWYDGVAFGHIWANLVGLKLTSVKKAPKSALLTLVISNFASALVLALSISICSAYFKTESV